jgi:hypothetical protein
LMGAAATATAPASLSNAFSASVGGARKLGSA